jgi:predicted nuclease of restriction endonuclease-like RecB superfamily
MLTADLAMSYRRGNRISPRYLQSDDPRHLQTAADLALIVEQHRGRRRAELERALDEYIGVGTDYKILRGLIKLLTDRCEFETAGAKDPSEIRRALFTKAAAHHSELAEMAVVADDRLRQLLIAEVAAELGCSPEEVMAGLYADLSGNQRLVAFEEMSAEDLLDRYNLAQAQALLYRCSEMRLWIEPQEQGVTRRLFAEIKAFRLIHAIRGNPASGYDAQLSGPVSIFHRSQRYGVQMAVFLPALLLYPGWRMRAEIGTKTGAAFFELDSKQKRLRSHYVADNLQPQNPQIAKLLEDFAKLDGEWSAQPSQEVIDLGETAFVPDLVFTRDVDEPIYLELLGYWTPRSLNERLKEFERAGFGNYAIAASEEMRCSRDAPSQLPPNVIIYKKSLNARELQARLARLIETFDILSANEVTK